MDDRFLPPELPAEHVAARLGLISDTHMPRRCAELPAAVFDVLRGVDLLLHAGDVGELWVLDRLSAIAPVIAVHGNDETAEAERELPYRQLVVAGGARILLTHGHYPDRAAEMASREDDAWEPKLARRAAMGRRAGARVVVFGHTHIPMAVARDGVLLVNPGAIASPNPATQQRIQTVAILFIRDDGAPFVTHVDLSHPDRPFAPRIDWQAGFRAAHARFTAPEEPNPRPLPSKEGE
jgi:putative phosphoesterase